MQNWRQDAGRAGRIGEGLAYRLDSICERKGWAEIARDYNALVISWGASQEQAVQLREQYQQGRPFSDE